MVKQFCMLMAMGGLLITMSAVSSVNMPSKKLQSTIKEKAVANNDALDAIFDDAYACGMINEDVERSSATEDFVQSLGCTMYVKWLALRKYAASLWATTLKQGTAWVNYGSSILNNSDDEVRAVAANK